MRQRTIVSIVFVAVWAALIALKWLVPDGWGALGFDLFFCVVSVICSYEFLRAFHETSHFQWALAVGFCAVTIPLYVAVEILTGQGLFALLLTFGVFELALACGCVFNHSESTVKGFAIASAGYLYCGILFALFSIINHLESNSMAALLVLFLVTVFTDTGAFLIGGALHKVFPKKMAPSLSPNKTVVGGIGGLVGGVAGALIAFLVIYYLGGLNGEVVLVGYNDVYLEYSHYVNMVLAFAIVGFVGGMFVQTGDLFESAIKRECDIKDMGKIMPGHGGMLDRLDGMLFCSIAVLVSFALII